MPRPVTQPHGTYAAARRHQRAGQPLCPACKQALADYQHRMYEARKARRVSSVPTANPQVT